MNASTYADKLAQFMALSPVFVEGHVRQTKGDGSVVTGWFVRRDDRHGACQCCGNTHLKVLWPVLTLYRTVYWIGRECQKNLQERGVLDIARAGFDNRVEVSHER